MKRKIFLLPGLITVLAAGTLLSACDLLGTSGPGADTGQIRLRFSGCDYVVTKASFELPDTNDFLLKVTDKSGAVIYSGSYGASPESMLVKAGTYNINVVSAEFNKPAFDAPQFGDEVCVVVPSGGIADVELVCRQINSGIKLTIPSNFLEIYPKGMLFLRSDLGKLLYAYKEKRIAFFNPGSVSLVLDDDGSESVLATRSLASQEILSLNLKFASPSGGGSGSGSGSGGGSSKSGGLSVIVDTTRYWSSENLSVGGGSASSGPGADYSTALTITQAKEAIGRTGVWVAGFIVGGDLSSSSTGISFAPPFTSATNIAIGPRSSTSAKSSCLSVQLSSGPIRDALNLSTNPKNLGRKVYLRGDIVSAYYGIPGLKNVTDFVLK